MYERNLKTCPRKLKKPQTSEYSVKESSPKIVRITAATRGFRNVEIEISLLLSVRTSTASRTKIMMYSIDILNSVKPKPSMKQSGKTPVQMDVIRNVVRGPNRKNNVLSLSLGKYRIRTKPSVSSNLPAIQN
jgi:hypothetical protein